MKFEDFEKAIRALGYGIVAMNHYTLGGKWRTYCVVLGENSTKAFKAEALKSNSVFANLYKQIIKYENTKTS